MIMVGAEMVKRGGVEAEKYVVWAGRGDTKKGQKRDTRGIKVGIWFNLIFGVYG